VDFSGFISGLLTGLISSAAAGGLVLYLGYRYVEQALRLQDASDRRREVDAQREQNRTSVLGAIHAELQSAAAHLQTLLTQLPTGAIPYPGFDLTGWPLASQAVIFTTLRQDTVEALTHAYNRMTTANEQLRLLSDLNHGPTAIVVTASAAGRLDDPEVAEAYKMFQDHRGAIRAGLIDRLRELKPHLDNAIDRVEEDTRRTADLPASQRHYLFLDPPSVIDVPRG